MSDPRRDLMRLTDSLGADIETFERRIARAALRAGGRRVARRVSARVPAARSQRPTAHRIVLPVPYRGGTPPMVLDRLRALEEQGRGRRSGFLGAIRRGARRFADAIRNGLAKLRDRFARLGSRRRRPRFRE